MAENWNSCASNKIAVYKKGDCKASDYFAVSFFIRNCEADERKRINSHAEKGDYVADVRKRINERPSGLVTLKPHKRSDLITS